jgi:hypothetical protein
MDMEALVERLPGLAALGEGGTDLLPVLRQPDCMTERPSARGRRLA